MPGRAGAGEWGLPEKLDKYSLVDRIASGGMGIVLRAHDPELERDVALKVLRVDMGEEVRARFMQEARQAAALRHPNIVAVHEVGNAEGRDYFTMDLVEGESLADRLKRGKPTVAEAVRIMKETVGAVAYAHSRGVIHRDLKPANVMLDSDGRALVTDFGLAKSVERESGMTQTGDFLGTPVYMSPEAASGDAPRIDERSDVYSLGVMLYEMLAGDVPFHHTNPMVLLVMHLDEEPEPPRRRDASIPRDLETIALKCLEKEKERRYATAKALLEDLDRYEKGEAILAHPPSVFYRLRKKVFRHKWAVAVSAAVLIAVAAGVLGWLAVRAERRRAEGQWELVFEDDFEREGLGGGWRIRSGKWKLEDGTLVCGGGEATILAPARAVGCVRIEYTAWVPEGHAPREFSCYLRASDDNPSAGYFFGFGAHENSCAKVERAARSGDVLRRGGRFVEPGKKYRIRVEFADARLRVQVNGRPFLAWRDLFPLRGGDKVGFYSWDEGAHFDDARVWVRRSAELVTALAGPDALYGAGEYEKAAAEYARLAEELRGKPAEEARLKEALAWLAIVAEERKRPREEQDEARIEHALAEAEPALSSLRRGELAAHAAMGLAQVMFERGRIEEAARIVCEAVELDPEADAAWELRAWPLGTGKEARSRGALKPAAVLFECAARLPGQDDFSAALALLEAGNALREAGDLEKPVAFFDEIERRFGHMAFVASQAASRKADLLQARGEPEKALAELERAEMEHSGERYTCAAARTDRVRILTDMGRLDEALKIAASVERDYPGQRDRCAQARMYIGLALRAAGRIEEALRVLASVGVDYSGLYFPVAQARYELGHTLCAAGRHEAALETLGSIEKDYPRIDGPRIIARRYRGGVLRAMGRLDEALEVLASVERDAPGRRGACAEARVDSGLTLCTMRRFSQALEVLVSVGRDYPDRRLVCAWARLHCGRTLLAMGSLEEALRAFATVEERYPEAREHCAGALLLAGAYAGGADASKYLGRAAAYRDQPHWSAPARYLLGEIGEAEFERLMFNWEWRPDVEYWKGEKACREGRKEDAVKHFSRAVETNIPNETWPLLEARTRLKELGAPVPPLPWEKKE